MEPCDNGMCSICGGDVTYGGRKGRYWSPDDGWTWGRMCRWCAEDFAGRKPQPGDYAYRDRDASMTAAEVDRYIDTMMG